jgi:hypothetical protein
MLSSEPKFSISLHEHLLWSSLIPIPVCKNYNGKRGKFVALSLVNCFPSGKAEYMSNACRIEFIIFQKKEKSGLKGLKTAKFIFILFGIDKSSNV